MKPVDQIEFRKTYGDCFRACVASIFEFPIQEMPNFWEETQDNVEFWIKVNEWLQKNKGFGCLTLEIKAEMMPILSNLLCVAVGKGFSDEDHAVVWKKGEIVHDPHPLKRGLNGSPYAYVIFFPMNIN